MGSGFGAAPSGAELGKSLPPMMASCRPVCPGKTGNLLQQARCASHPTWERLAAWLFLASQNHLWQGVGRALRRPRWGLPGWSSGLLPSADTPAAWVVSKIWCCAVQSIPHHINLMILRWWLRDLMRNVLRRSTGNSGKVVQFQNDPINQSYGTSIFLHW